MKQYLDLMKLVLDRGEPRMDRTGTGTLSIFGHQMRFDLSEGFPLLTTKRLHFHSIVTELLWILRGDTNVKYLNEHGVTIWDEWANQEGGLGPVYGAQIRKWMMVYDQLAIVIDGLKKDPRSRRHIVSSWNVAELDAMVLPPCHLLFQFYLGRGDRLHCQLYQRSGDVFLGVPFNIASYSLLTMMVAKEIGAVPGEFIHVLGDAHLYSNHLEQAKLQITRETRELPRVSFPLKNILMAQYEPSDFTLEGYNPHPHIPGEVAV